MPSTVTLAQTTLTYPVEPKATEVTLASVAGLESGMRLFVDRELMAVLSIVPGTTRVNVKRGIEGSPAARHYSSAIVTLGYPQQFYSHDPLSAPRIEMLVSPWINVQNGKVFYAQGDSQPDGGVFRWWQESVPTYGIGPLGVRTTTYDPTSST